jgi:hypothetical protein
MMASKESMEMEIMAANDSRDPETMEESSVANDDLYSICPREKVACC